MKKLLFGCAFAAAGLLTTAANANFVGGPMGCDPCCDVGSFNGLYVGGNVGAATHHFERNDLDGFFDTPRTFSVARTAVTAGVQLGYDMQFCNKLAGLVVDWNWTNPRRSFAPVFGDAGRFRDRNRWFTTIRGRFGLTVCDALVYVTLGGVVTRLETSFDDGLGSVFRDRRSRWGWTGGVGTEWMLGCNWSLGAEVLLLNYCDRDRRVAVAGETFRFIGSDLGWVGRILLNYRFGDLCGCF